MSPVSVRVLRFCAKNQSAFENLWNRAQLMLAPKGRHLSTKYFQTLLEGSRAHITIHRRDKTDSGKILKALEALVFTV